MRNASFDHRSRIAVARARVRPHAPPRSSRSCCNGRRRTSPRASTSRCGSRRSPSSRRPIPASRSSRCSSRARTTGPSSSPRRRRRRRRASSRSTSPPPRTTATCCRSTSTATPSPPTSAARGATRMLSSREVEGPALRPADLGRHVRGDLQPRPRRQGRARSRQAAEDLRRVRRVGARSSPATTSGPPRCSAARPTPRRACC